MAKKKGERKLSRTKTYGFNPWLDQIDSINTLMYRNAGVKESVILRKLIDEALEARRHDPARRHRDRRGSAPRAPSGRPAANRLER